MHLTEGEYTEYTETKKEWFFTTRNQTTQLKTGYKANERVLKRETKNVWETFKNY